MPWLQVDSWSSRVRSALGAEGEGKGLNGGGGAVGSPGELGLPARLVGWPIGDAVHGVAQSIARLPEFATTKDVKQVRALLSASCCFQL